MSAEAKILRTDITPVFERKTGLSYWRAHWWTKRGYSSRTSMTREGALGELQLAISRESRREK